MKRIVLTYGLISGAVLVAMFAVSLPLTLNGTIDFSNSQLIGYASMVVAFLIVFFGVRKYRDTIAGGTITFGKAFQVGLLISLVTCAVYVVSWQIAYYGFLPDFADRYEALTLENMREKNASEAEIAAVTKQMAGFKELYANPLFNIGITFLEVFPVALIMSLISAAIVRRRGTGGAPVSVSRTL